MHLVSPMNVHHTVSRRSSGHLILFFGYTKITDNCVRSSYRNSELNGPIRQDLGRGKTEVFNIARFHVYLVELICVHLLNAPRYMPEWKQGLRIGINRLPQPAMVINLLWGLSALSKLRSKPCLKLEKTVYLDEPRQRWMTYYVIPTAFLQAV